MSAATLRRPEKEASAARPKRSGTYAVTRPRELDPVDVLLEDFMREGHGNDEHLGAERLERVRDERGERESIPDM